MAMPKKRTSRSRRGMRRAHRALSFYGLGTCSHCQAPLRPHHLCLSCGYYKNRQILG